MPFIIQRKPPYRVYVEEGHGSAMAHVAELPGCFSVGSSAARAVQAMPGAIAGFLVWLRSHREPLVPEAHVARPSVADLFVADIIHKGASLMGGGAMFEYDKEAWPDDKFERTLRWLGYSRADLLARVEGLSDADMRAMQLAPGKSMYSALMHVAGTEYSYVDAVAGPLERLEPAEPDVRERLLTTRELLLGRAGEVPPAARGAIVLPVWSSHPDDPWTLSKVLRRALEHEREHTADFRL